MTETLTSTPGSGESVPHPKSSTVESDSLPGILTQLGLILTPAGIIALFCQVLDVSPQSTAAISLSAAALTSICIYRKLINKSIPAALFAALLVGLATVFFFNYKNILLKDTGLIKYYKRSNDFLSDLDTEINRSKQEIWFFGTNFNISAGERRELLLKKLEGGVKIRFLVFDPDSARLDDLARDFSQSPAELKSECQKGIQSIIELDKQWRIRAKSAATPGELEIRIFETHPHARLYFFDPRRSEGTSYFVPYVSDVNSPNVPGFLLGNIDGGVYKAYFDGTLKLWSDSGGLNARISTP